MGASDGVSVSVFGSRQGDFQALYNIVSYVQLLEGGIRHTTANSKVRVVQIVS